MTNEKPSKNLKDLIAYLYIGSVLIALALWIKGLITSFI